jgi:hypothetical protein
LAVVATLTKGYDLDYIWRQVDHDLTKDAILQPPKPQIQPSRQILERVAGRALDLEAGS